MRLLWVYTFAFVLIFAFIFQNVHADELQKKGPGHKGVIHRDRSRSNGSPKHRNGGARNDHRSPSDDHDSPGRKHHNSKHKDHRNKFSRKNQSGRGRHH